MAGAYYNEIDPYAAQWLRNLIAKGHIAAGEVDERSIEDVRPDDLRGFTQCHFFAGIGVWSYALRLAGWADDRPVWTGSCPCQPFSAAGKGLGFADERHLWPAWFHLISECRPPVILGEQVASKDVDPWIDLVHADVETLDNAFGCQPFPAAGVGTPGIRDRAFWMADADYARPQGRQRVRERAAERAARSRSLAGGLAHAYSRTRREGGALIRGRPDRSDAQSRPGSGGGSLLGGVADADSNRCTPQAGGALRHEEHHAQSRSCSVEGQPPSGPTNGFWRDADWLFCRDGKWRPVEPGTFPLADGAPARVGRLRAYGNAINAQAAAEFIRAAREAIEQVRTI